VFTKTGLKGDEGDVVGEQDSQKLDGSNDDLGFNGNEENGVQSKDQDQDEEIIKEEEGKEEE